MEEHIALVGISQKYQTLGCGGDRLQVDNSPKGPQSRQNLDDCKGTPHKALTTTDYKDASSAPQLPTCVQTSCSLSRPKLNNCKGAGHKAIAPGHKDPSTHELPTCMQTSCVTEQELVNQKRRPEREKRNQTENSGREMGRHDV